MNEVTPGKLPRPTLDPGFVPAVLWNRLYRKRCDADSRSLPLSLALERPDGTTFAYRTKVLPWSPDTSADTVRYVERLVKFLLWQKGGSTIHVGGPPEIGAAIADAYREGGTRAFDNELIGVKVFQQPLQVVNCAEAEVPAAREQSIVLGRHLDGCRVGFDLGGSDRKSAAVVDGEVVFSEEVPWSPYFEKDPQYHYDGIRDSIERAARHLPRVDAIGGSAAGVYVNSEPCVASLFRGVSDTDFQRHVRPMFSRLQSERGNVPFEVVNDGEVTALAGSMSIKDNALLGVAMGTSLAAGYCNAEGNITPWLNELAFVPVDYRLDAPADEWSGDVGCGVQYFSQQAVARLAPSAGIDFADDVPFPERLKAVQERMERDDPAARRIYETIGVYFGYTLAWFAEFYETRHLLLLGRVTSGEGGAVIIREGQRVLNAVSPELGAAVAISTPDEQLKRHGQAIAAASLPEIESEGSG